MFPIKWKRVSSDIDFEIDAQDARFEEIYLEKLRFAQKVTLSRATFNSVVMLREVKFNGEALFEYVDFRGSLEINHGEFQKRTVFHRATFRDDVLLRAHFADKVSFAESSFRSAAHFAGWRNISLVLEAASFGISAGAVAVSTGGESSRLMRIKESFARSYGATIAASKKLVQLLRAQVGRACRRVKSGLRSLYHRYRRTSPNVEVFSVFGDEVEFTAVTFSSPSLVFFNQVDMSRTYLRGTNLRGATFLNVNWWQPLLRRNGLHDELLIARSPDGAFRWQNLPILEETYRTVRLALEESKNYTAATDFYIGEMDTYRARLGFWRGRLFSVPAWYRMLSFYGTSVTRAMVVLIVVICAHAVFSAAIQDVPTTVADFFRGDLILRSLRLATLQSGEVGVVPTFAQICADTVFRIVSAVQIALLVFAFRTRIRRH